jgi:hypothetical protein
MPIMRFLVFGFWFLVRRNSKGLRPAFRLLAVFLALAIFGLGAAAGAAENGLKARLVNKKPTGEAGPVSFYVGQVEVTLPDGTRKLLPHWSYMEPQVAGDRVIFLPTEGVQLTRIFFYDPKTDKTSSYRLPLDMDPYFGSPSFAPDGDKLAYYLHKDQKVIVRSWPSLKLLKESERFPMRPTDVPPMPPVWTSPTKVQFDPLFFLPDRQVSFDLTQ